MTKKWQVISSKKEFLSEEEVVDELLKNRNIGKSQREEFFSPDINSLRLSSVGIESLEFQKFKKRIDSAFRKNEKIVIYGDYDVDGISATAILWETLYSVYKNVKPYIPGRADEGYGLSIKGIDNLLTEYPDLKIIITVDNGIVANEAVKYANEKGIDVVITDHHVKGKKLPDAFVILHTTELCGAGIAWLLSRELGYDTKENVYERLELVTLATIADLVPLNKWNRCIVVHGLKILRKTKRKGLLALLADSNLESKNINVYSIGHILSPRLNATGRITHAMDSLRLVCTKDLARARELAIKLGRINRERQSLTESAVSHAKLSIIAKTKGKKILVVAHESYNQGVVGLIASKLVESYYLPSIAISMGEKISKGSARSINGVNIIELLRSVSDTLEEAGGHPMAAGFSVATDRISEFQKALEKKALEIDKELFERILKIDLLLNFDLIGSDLYEKILFLSPFGMGNPEPVFATENVKVEEVRKIGKEANHLKLKVSDKGKIFDAVGFGLAENFDLEKGDTINIAYTIDENVWNGKTSIQLKLRDLRLV